MELVFFRILSSTKGEGYDRWQEEQQNTEHKNKRQQFTDQIERREFTMLLDNFEGYDVQATRKESKAEEVVYLLSELEPIPEKIHHRIMSETNLEALRRWIKTAARADSLQQFLEKCPEIMR